MFWCPFLSFLAIVVAWAMSQEGNRLALALAGLVATSLVVDLAFFRHEDVASQRVLCSDDILAGTGFERGMVPYWHAREVGVTGGSGAIHLVYATESEIPYLLASPTAGNVQHNLGSADYGVARHWDNPHVLTNFKKAFGIPSRISSCDVEIYFLYSNKKLDSSALFYRMGAWGTAETYIK